MLLFWIQFWVKKSLSKSLLPMAQQRRRQWFSYRLCNKVTPWSVPIENPTKYHVFLASKFLHRKKGQFLYCKRQHKKTSQTSLYSIDSFTSHTMQQSWFTPFSPFFENTEAKVSEPSALSTPEVHNIESFLFASFIMAFAASCPPSLPRLPEFLPFLKENDLASPLNMVEKCPISLAIPILTTPLIPNFGYSF